MLSFSKTDIILWTSSVMTIIISFFAFGGEGFLTLCASLIGVTSLIFCAKGNPMGQVLMVIFSILYGIISFSFTYYGEMITYLGMTLPMAVFSFVVWLRNPYKGNKAEVEVNTVSKKEIIFICFLTLICTFVFYFVLESFGTANLVPSTFSVTTSFFAACLTLKRSPYFALAYAVNDIVLIILWILASLSDISYVSVVICFVVFLVNDIYGYISWQKMKASQHNDVLSCAYAELSEKTDG